MASGVAALAAASAFWVRATAARVRALGARGSKAEGKHSVLALCNDSSMRFSTSGTARLPLMAAGAVGIAAPLRLGAGPTRPSRPPTPRATTRPQPAIRPLGLGLGLAAPSVGRW